MARTPTYFIPHGGGPCFFMDWTPPETWASLADWLRTLPAELDGPPTALLVISAHWVEGTCTLLAKNEPELLYDYYGFPEHTYHLSWPAPSAPSLLQKVKELLTEAGISHADDSGRDYDHGVFVPGLLSFPDANIPTLQVSLLRGLSPIAHLSLGRALAPLRDEGVLIVGSGMSFHNMHAFRRHDNKPIPGADAFDAWLRETLTLDDAEERGVRLERWEQAQGARFAHPNEDHLLPLMVAAGAAEGDVGRVAFSCRAMGAPLTAFRFG